MIKTRELKLYVENMEGFRKKLKGELRQIDRGKAKTLGEDSISFHSLDQLRKYLTPKRLELLRMIRHHKPESIYGLAKLVGRTPENVNTDIRMLEQFGFVETTKIKEVRKKSVPEVCYDRMMLEIPI